jgi:hypothetical protein
MCAIDQILLPSMPFHPSSVQYTPLRSPDMWDLLEEMSILPPHPVRLAYQPPASGTFLSEQTSHQ